MDVELKPCPFCGGRVIHMTEHDGCDHLEHLGRCCICSTKGPSALCRAEAIKLWNTRTEANDDR